MSLKTIFCLAITWMISLLVVASVVKAQVWEIPQPLPEPRIVSGPDFGFRIEADLRGTPVGKLVVRVDGRWIEAQVAAEPRVRRVGPE